MKQATITHYEKGQGQLQLKQVITHQEISNNPFAFLPMADK